MNNPQEKPMPITVYNISGAPRGWRVLVGLELKGLDYKVQHLSASDGEHKQPAFLNINPRGTVPALTTETITLCDSIAILAWLDREYPHNLLFGEPHKRLLKSGSSHSTVAITYVQPCIKLCGRI